MAAETARRDPNFVTTIQGVDLSTGSEPTNIYVDETTHRMLVNAVISNGPLLPVSDFDYLGIVNTNTDEDTLTYKDGGAAGTTVRTLVVTYAAGASKISDDLASLEYS